MYSTPTDCGLPLTRLVVALLGRRGEILVEGVCLLLFGRAVQFIASGAPGKLRTLPRRLAYVELAVDGLAVMSGLWLSAGQAYSGPRRHGLLNRDGGARVSQLRQLNTLSVASMFFVHSVRFAIYLSPGRGRSDAHQDSMPREIAAGVYWLRVGGSNVYFVRSGSSWVLIDTGNAIRVLEPVTELRSIAD